jgi:hypothetical protein
MAGPPSADASPPPDDDAASGEGALEDEAASESNAPRERGVERARERLLAPIGGLYALAQAVTGTERAARSAARS